MTSFFAPSWHVLSWGVYKRLMIDTFHLAKSVFKTCFGGLKIFLLPIAFGLCGLAWMATESKSTDGFIEGLSKLPFLADVGVDALHSNARIFVVLALCLWGVAHILITRVTYLNWSEIWCNGKAKHKGHSWLVFVLMTWSPSWGLMYLDSSDSSTGEDGSLFGALAWAVEMFFRLLPVHVVFFVAMGLVKMLAVIAELVPFAWLLTSKGESEPSILVFFTLLEIVAGVTWNFFKVFFLLAFSFQVYGCLRAKFPDLFFKETPEELNEQN